jgi:hypothetical protein
MADDDNPQPMADTEQQKAVFVCRMIRIEEPDGMFVEKRRLRLIERNAVFAHVRPAFRLVPLKPQLIHTYNVHFL